METTNDNIGSTVSFPFYVFISLLLGYMGVSAGRALWGVSGLFVISCILFICHIGLYWLNYWKKNKLSGWWSFYYPAQAILMITIVLLMNGRSSIGLSFIGSAAICIVGEGLGLWGNSRRALLIGVSYFGLMFVLFYLFMERVNFYEAAFSMLVNGGIIVIFMVMFNQQLIERQKAVDLAESLESVNAKLAASAARVESLTLQNERQRMARELHDTLAQGVAGLVLQLEAVKTHLKAGRAERASAIVEQSLVRARSTLADSRAAIDDLRAVHVNLAESVREKVEQFTQATGIACELEISLSEHKIAMEVEEHVLRVLSEILANVARHAQAGKVNVKITNQKGQLELEICDNGIGFDVESETNAGHYGLLGMRERARLLHGTLTVESAANSGTNVRFVVPSLQGGEKR